MSEFSILLLLPVFLLIFSKRLDQKIVDIFEPISHEIQRYTGKSNRYQAVAVMVFNLLFQAVT